MATPYEGACGDAAARKGVILIMRTIDRQNLEALAQAALQIDCRASHAQESMRVLLVKLEIHDDLQAIRNITNIMRQAIEGMLCEPKEGWKGTARDVVGL